MPEGVCPLPALSRVDGAGSGHANRGANRETANR